MRWGQVIPILTLLLLWPIAASAEVVKYAFVAEDEAVLHSFGGGGKIARPQAYDQANQHFILVPDDGTPDGQYVSSKVTGGTTYFLKTGLFSGVYLSSTYNTYLVGRFFLKFNLPDVPDGHFLSKATLIGNYAADRSPSSDQTHSIYYVPDDTWAEKHPTKDVPGLNADRNANANPFPGAAQGITWNNKPQSGFDLGYGAIASFVPSQMATLGWKSWDVTSAVQGEYANLDSILSLMFKADDETESGAVLNMEEFAEKDFNSLNDKSEVCGFYIEFKFSPVPEPSAMVALAGMLLSVALFGWRRRWHGV